MGIPRINYTAKDYESIRKELIERIPMITDRWTDFNESDLGMTLLELFAGVADMLAFYLDNQANEAYLPTARQRQNIINLTKLINYRLDRPVAATTTLAFSLSEPFTYDVTIPKHTRCRATTDSGDIDFVTERELIIPAGETLGMVGGVQGVIVNEEFIYNGNPGQSLELVHKNIAEGFFEVRIDDILWTEVDSFYDSSPLDKHYVLETDGQDVTKIIFGDGQFGSYPANGKIVKVSFLETKGLEGNLGKYRVNRLLDFIYHGSTLIDVSVTNIQHSTNGIQRESIEHARKQAPLEIATLWRAVTKSDYIALAEGFAGIAKAQVLDVNDCEVIGYYQVCVVIAPDGGGLPSQLLKDRLLNYLNDRKVVTVKVNVYDPVYVPVNVNATLYVYKNYNLNVVRNSVIEKLHAELSFENLGFQQDVHFSDLVALMDGAEGVSHIEMDEPASDVKVGSGEIAKKGSLTINTVYVE